MVRISSVLLGVLALAGCASQAPDSYQGYMRNHAGGTGGYPQPAAAPAPAAPQGFSTEGALNAINAAGTTPAATAPLPYGERPRGNAPTNIRTEMGEMAGVAGHTGISNENSFEAVSAQRSIAEDAAVIAQNRSQYVQVQPTAVPTRPSANGPNIVSYALQQNHPRGQQMYGRSSLRLGKPQQQCSQFLSADLAQQAFLAAGGPQRDRNNLDPDGDGYACAWDPAPFRAAAAR